jgi:hypothetical protein
MKQISVDYIKYITHNGTDVFKMVKTKTNKYYLVDLKTNKIIANSKKEILQKIIEYKKMEELKND